jgi:hypothetical protein
MYLSRMPTHTLGKQVKTIAHAEKNQRLTGWVIPEPAMPCRPQEAPLPSSNPLKYIEKCPRTPLGDLSEGWWHAS